MERVALTIAGSDPSGGAGLQADLKTFAAFGVYGASVVSALTAQNTRGVRAVANVDPAFVGQQLDAVLEDLHVAAAKTGMLAHAAVIEVVVERWRARPAVPLVVDPVMIATSGAALLDPAAVAVLREQLLPLAALVTPNLHEAAVLADRPVTDVSAMHAVARALVGLGARAALVKGGHLDGPAIDVLYDGESVRELVAERVAVGPTHGAGCTLSAAITAGLAVGRPLPDAVAVAKRWVTRALVTAAAVGHGARPLNHLVRPDD